MSLNEFTDCYGTEAKCEARLERARWPDGEQWVSDVFIYTGKMWDYAGYNA
ncbi:MAG: hypothetical protein WCA32_01310 [Chromatiaceae bacterium]|jgi:hypothetical protein